MSEMSTSRGKVVVAMSGGVDSSVAAALLQEEGYDVVGCFMRLGNPEGVSLECSSSGETRGCCSVKDASDARLVAARLGVGFYVVNFEKDFGRVIDYFVGEYNQGRTPNPCVRCNDWLKFGKLHDYAMTIDADYIASGHYAQVEHRPEGPRLLQGVDSTKDQSYVLFGMPRSQLAKTLLPIGGYTKTEIRELAERFDLPVAQKRESMEICFVPDDDYAGLLKRRTPGAIEEGEILDTEGNCVGSHGGHQNFTIGQRRGVGMALGYPIYVVAKNPEANTVTIGSKADLQIDQCTAGDVNWLIDADSSWQTCRARIRSTAPPVPARLRGLDDGRIEVSFDDPVDSLAAGQAVVCYDGDAVICGGWVDQAGK